MHAIAQKLKKIRPEIWVFTLALLVFNGTLLAGHVSSVFVFSTDQVGAGDWWRVFTFPFVHVSIYHFLLDASAFLMLYQGLQETSAKRRLLYVVACAAGSLGLSLLTSTLSGGLCGLSGIAHGLMAVTGLELMRSTNLSLRQAGIICFALTLIKSLFEAATGQVVFSFLHLGSVGSPIATCHLGGILGGGMAYILFNHFLNQPGTKAFAVNKPSCSAMKKGAAVLMALIIAIAGVACPQNKLPIQQKQETVVLLHGLVRSDKAMNKMAEELRADGYRVINHDYPSTSATIEKLTSEIFRSLEPQIKNEQTVHFVTHSMGGIILRQHLENHPLPNLGKVVMLAPPSRGSEVTDKLGGIFLYQWINGPAGSQLGTGTNSLPLRLKAPEFELGIIAGDRSINPFLSMLIPGPDDGKVSLARVKPESYTDYVQLHVTHPGMMWNRKVIAQTQQFLEYGQFKTEEVHHD